MLKQTITYTDFNGTPRTEDLYFNLTEFELVEIQSDSEKGIQADLQDAIRDKDLRRLLAFIKMLVNKAYGIKSEDGKHFEKSPEILQRFQNSALYSDLLLNLFEDEGTRAEKFITGLMPKELIARATAKAQGQGGVPEGYKPDARQLAEQFRTQQNIPEAVFEEPKFEEAPPIGRAGDVVFQAPPQNQPTVPPHQQNVQSEPSTEPARVDSPIIPGGYTEISKAPTLPSETADHKPFRIKETPIEQASTGAHAAETDEQAEFEAWKAAQRDKSQN